MKRILFLLLFLPVFAYAVPLYSPTWGFKLDLPEGYEFVDGDGRDRFSFGGPSGAMFDIVVYDGTYRNLEELVLDINRRISNNGDADFIQYQGRQAVIIELDFNSFNGWGFAIELDGADSPILLALAYGPSNIESLMLFHISALDSIVPCYTEGHYPGPIMEYLYPRGERVRTALGSTGLFAMMYENDAIAAQSLIEREFGILVNYLNTPFIYDAWNRYYRLIYRDSWDRVSSAVSVLNENWGASAARSEEAKFAFAQRALSFVQRFDYERNLDGSDFVNLVTAVTEGRGDCDSRAMLWAIMLANAGIRSAMMISPHYSHAMGLADIAGNGARFEAFGTRWLVAETTAAINIGLIDQEMSDIRHWMSIIFE